MSCLIPVSYNNRLKVILVILVFLPHLFFPAILSLSVSLWFSHSYALEVFLVIILLPQLLYQAFLLFHPSLVSDSGCFFFSDASKKIDRPWQSPLPFPASDFFSSFVISVLLDYSTNAAQIPLRHPLSSSSRLPKRERVIKQAISLSVIFYYRNI